MNRFARALMKARIRGYAAEMRFWAAFAERQGYRGAERLRAMAEAAEPSGAGERRGSHA